MTGSALIQIALALSLIYTLFSLLVSVFNEWIARFIDLRRRILRQEIDRLLGDELVSRFRLHPVYAGQCESGKDPEYLASEIVALILIDLLFHYDPPEKPGYPGTVKVEKTLTCEREKKLAETLLMHASNLDAIQKRIMSWFDLSMEQATGRYKKAIQYVNAIFALLICACLNLDTAGIAWMIYKSGSALYPIGWPGNMPHDLGEWLLRIPGILISAGAISLGAPFWFDMINKLVNLRQTGLPPDENRISLSAH